MNNALEIFQRVPRTHNCAQSVAVGCGHPELVAGLASCGGGRAPEGRCGALHAAMLMAGPEKQETIRRQFVAENGSEFCRELKSVHHVPCEKCVECASRLFEESKG